jgi:hypothetical protein
MKPQLCALVVLLLCLSLTQADEEVFEGWRFKDRFAGFRFEVEGELDVKNAIKAIVDQADELAGFGWVQLWKRTRHIVGEFRGTPVTAGLMEEFLQQELPTASSSATLLRYADTKIRYHFSHFKILTSERNTCFEEAPHKCTPDEERKHQKEL